MTNNNKLYIRSGIWTDSKKGKLQIFYRSLPLFNKLTPWVLRADDFHETS